MTLKSVEGKMNPSQRKHCFEIFGYDFMIDQSLRPWLIEVNTNPCLEETSRLLRDLLPRMLDDAFKLSVDVMYPPFSNKNKLTKHSSVVEFGEAEPTKTFPVEGYSDSENLWRH
eukprot:CAMPEP_0170512188 /NCGR_PEP_ID=MMETSP0208-20121228/66713_1 /TAXON_ID=197538 /ORGANISM="Strombidium inclinatum, Strain S3" /LENGTH=113 /DNA_ID=CAMNT_0010795797 /DNA_START=1908 /DNA_END=2246 /DNA_ORIENTATION=+